MANRLKMAISDSIFTLHGRGWSGRRIARELGIDRETVARHLRVLQESKPATAPIGSEAFQAGAKPAIAPLGSGDWAADSNPATAPLGSGASDDGPRTELAAVDCGPTAMPSATGSQHGSRQFSHCEPHREFVLAALDRGLSAQRIYQDLVAEHGFASSYYSVRRFIRRVGASVEWPVRRLECVPGEECQVDFGTGAPIVTSEGQRQRTHVFRVVLSHSRKGYSEVVRRQTTDDFIRCLENAFAHFGGVPQRVVLDNLRAAVRKADWFEPDLNPKVQAFAQHYGTIFWPTRPYTPRHKGKVERGVDYVQENALRGRTFTSIDAQNQFLHDWERTVADTRIHGTTRRQVGQAFLESERAALLPLPVERFPCFCEARRTVHRDGHIELKRAYYSVPPEYLGLPVWVRWDGRLVRIFTEQMKPIAVHVQHESGRFSTQSKHIASEKINSIERGAAWILGRIRHIGDHAAGWAEGVIQTRGVEGVRVVQGLLSLADRHDADAIDRACEIAHSYSAYRLRTVRQLIDRDVAQQPVAFLQDHPLIRSLMDYAEFVHNTFQKEVSR